jgi:hypothetical protein
MGALHYEVLPVKVKDDPKEVAEDIAAAYREVAQRCGAVVAGYTLSCDYRSEEEAGTSEPGSSYLFIVAEFSHQDRQSERRISIRREGGKASKRMTR